MIASAPPSILCLASEFKGERFVRRARARGARVHLVTEASLVDSPWPHDALEGLYAQPSPYTLDDRIKFVAYLARDRRFDRIVALDEFDVDTAAALREHFRLPGPGMTEARAFRDKLAMRELCERRGVLVPEFTALTSDEEVREFVRGVPRPWMCKPRWGASAVGITKVQNDQELWSLIGSLGDARTYHLVERYVPGDVYHVDSIVAGRRVTFSAAHECGSPPFDIMHDGGIFSSMTVERGSDVEQELLTRNREVVKALGVSVGATHAEFVRGRSDGRFYLLECAARVGGAHITELVEAATGLNPWSEWADAEIDGLDYKAGRERHDYGGLVITLARQAHPDLSSYESTEVFYRAPEPFHAGLVVSSPERRRVQELVGDYREGFRRDFWTSQPAALH